jgi:hypothetical protein
MEIKINFDEKMLRDFGLGSFVDKTKVFNPIVVKQMMRGFPRRGLRRSSIPVFRRQPMDFNKSPLQSEVERAESLATISLKQDVKEILESKEKSELIRFVLNRLNVEGLGRLVQNY